MGIYTEKYESYCDSFKAWEENHPDISMLLWRFKGLPDELNTLAVEGEKYPRPDLETVPPEMRSFLCAPLDSELTHKAEGLIKRAVVDSMSELQAAGLAAMYNTEWNSGTLTYEYTYTWSIREILELYAKRHPGEIESVVTDPVDGAKWRWAAPTADKLEKAKNLTVKQIRASTGLSQQAFAERFGIPRRTLENWESGVNNPPQYVVTMLARLNYMV